MTYYLRYDYSKWEHLNLTSAEKYEIDQLSPDERYAVLKRLDEEAQRSKNWGQRRKLLT